MHVYFVRHGETALGRAFIHQSPNTPLSERGREVAATVAEELRSVNPTLLLSSEYTRALETARIIGYHTGLTPSVPGLFYEVVRPSSLYGCSHFSPRTIWYVLMSYLKRMDPAWRYEDAENFNDIRVRAEKALAYLEPLASEHASIVVVSHSVFLNVMVSYLCRSRLLSTFEFLLTFLHVERMKHGAIVHLEYHESEKGTCSWNIVPAYNQ